MGVRENKVERYLRKEVKAQGGDTRKWVSPGQDGVPDQVVIIRPIVFFCEVKTVDGELSSAQVREHKRLRALGGIVVTVYGNKGVDLLIKDLISYRIPLENSYA